MLHKSELLGKNASPNTTECKNVTSTNQKILKNIKSLVNSDETILKLNFEFSIKTEIFILYTFKNKGYKCARSRVKFNPKSKMAT